MGVLIVLCVFRLYVCLFFCVCLQSIEFDRISISFSACFSVWTGNSSCVHLFEVSTYWKVCIHLNILSLVCVQVIQQLS